MKKIAVDTAKSILKEHKGDGATTVTVPVGDNSIEVKIKTSLTINEKSTFINRVLSGCFDNRGNFRPEYVSPMMRATILQMCTNLPVLSAKGEKTDDGKATMDMDAMNELYMTLNLDHLNDGSYQDMVGEIIHLTGQAIDWRRGRVLAEHETDATLRRLLDALTKKVESVDMEELQKYAGELSRRTDGLDANAVVGKLIELHREDSKTE